MTELKLLNPAARATTPVMAQAPLAYDAAVRAKTDHLYARVEKRISPPEWRLHAPYIAAINDLKAAMNAVILAHNYMTPEIYFGVGDFAGDSLQLAREAARTEADIIVQAGVHFMAETSKILSPSKTVLIPDLRAGCSLASSITGADVRLIKARYPGAPVVAYVNTTADVKAETDVCCTSSNAVEIVEWAAREWGSETVILIPDQYLARNVAAMTRVKIVTWAGACEVHERFTAADIAELREAQAGLVVLAHPECPPDVVAAADFTGSTSGMSAFVKRERPAHVVLITECSMSDNVALENPDVNFLRPCNLCPHMKRITLPKILASLQTMTHEVTLDERIIECARAPIERMIALPLKGQSLYERRHAGDVAAIETRN